MHSSIHPYPPSPPAPYLYYLLQPAGNPHGCRHGRGGMPYIKATFKDPWYPSDIATAIVWIITSLLSALRYLVIKVLSKVRMVSLGAGESSKNCRAFLDKAFNSSSMVDYIFSISSRLLLSAASSSQKSYVRRPCSRHVRQPHSIAG